jgi:acetyl esterase
MSPLEPLDPQTLAVLEAAAHAPQTFQLPLAETRAAFDANMARSPATHSASLEDFEIPSPAGPVSLRLIRPTGIHAPLPILVYFHGGGWVVGGKSSHDRFARSLAHTAHAAVLFVDYSLSPESRFPAAIEQAYAAAAWAATRNASHGLDGARVALFGDSAGGNMAAVVTLLAKLRGGPRLCHQTLLCPVIDPSFDTPSYSQFAHGYLLSREAMEWFWRQYLPPDLAAPGKLVSPLRATSDELEGLPPALVLTAECDVLRDEGEAYARKLIAANVPVTAARFLATLHNFPVHPVLHRTPAARQTMSLVRTALAEAFA